MVYTASSTAASENTISLARSYADRPQQVSVTMNGFDYPGEVIFADQWQPWFGAALPERVMFRLVLLSSPGRMDRSDVTDRFVAVAVPSAQDADFQPNEFAQLNREIGRLNEIRERYVTSGDSGLRALASSLTGKAHEAQRNIAGVLAGRWRKGEVVTADGTAQVSTDSVFIDDEPGAWVEAVAAVMFTRPAGSLTESRSRDNGVAPEEMFSRIVKDEPASWRGALDSRIRSAAGVGLDELLEDPGTVIAGKVPGDELRHRLLRECGLPSGLASLFVAAYIKLNNGEAGIVPGGTGSNTRLDTHTLGAGGYDPDLIYSVLWLSESKTDDWNSALPYVRALLPHAAPSDDGAPGSQLEDQFTRALQVAESRTTLTLHTLASVAGPAIESLPSVQLARRLVPVLESPGWKEFYSAAASEFPNAAEFLDAVSESARLRTLCEDAVDVQAAREYVAGADFGRQDQSLTTDADLLLARLDVAAILTSQSSAGAVLHEFQQWRRRFTGAYLEHHAERRSADLELARRITEAERRHQAVQKLAAIPELSDIYAPAFAAGWTELQERVKPCPNREHEVSLQANPYCDDCGVRMGSSGHEDEVEARIADIEQMLRRCSTRLGEIAVSRVLSGEREDEIRKLVQINSLADLTAVSHVLDDGLVSFLQRFASDSEAG